MFHPKPIHAALGAWCRVFSCVCAASLLAIGVFGWQARARAHELFQTAGEQMLTYARATHVSPGRTLQVNGVALRLLSGSSPDSVPAVLDAMHAGCRSTDGQLEKQLQEASHGRLPRIAHRGVPYDGVLRRNDEANGYVACLDLGALEVSPTALLKRVQDFLRSGDLSKVGDLRFVWALREGNQTAYVAVFSEGAFPLTSMFPSQGDAPGIDVPSLPRPESSRRLLSAWQQNEAPLLVAYRVAKPQGTVESDWRALLVQRGYAVSDQGTVVGATSALLAERDSTSALIVLASDGARTLATVTPLR